MFDPKYKLKYRPPSISRLMRYKYLPPPMVGDPIITNRGWEKVMWAKYAILIAEKRGELPPLPSHKMRGLWMWEYRDASKRQADVGTDCVAATDHSVVELSADGAI